MDPIHWVRVHVKIHFLLLLFFPGTVEGKNNILLGYQYELFGVPNVVCWEHLGEVRKKN